MDTRQIRHHTTIAFLIDSLFDDYQITLWKSTLQACRGAGINFISFLGGILWFKHFFQGSRNKIYDLVSAERIDGIIACSNTFFYNTPKDEMECYFREKFNFIPLVSVGTQLDGFPSIVSNNKIGMKELLRHLITVHGYKKIAFINGLKMNIDAYERFMAYKEILAEYEIPYDKNLVFDGEFTLESGRKAVLEILDKRKVQCDVIAAANDLMAVSVISELLHRGIDIPSGIAVTGFDNSPVLYGYYPPLTTISQPVAEMGRQAVRIISDLIGGGKVDPVTVLPTFPVIRSSCGCGMSFVDENEPDYSDALDVVFKNYSPEISFIRDSKNDKKNNAGTVVLDGLLNSLEDKIKQSIMESSPAIFYSYLRKIIHQLFIQKLKINDYYFIINPVFSSLKQSMDYRYINDIDHLQAQCMKILLRVDNYMQTRTQMVIEKDKAIVYRFVQRLSTSISREYILKAFEEELPDIGIKNFFIFIFTDEDEGKKTMAVLDFFISMDNTFEINKELKEFPANRLFPGNIRDDKVTFDIVVYPLFFKSENFGYFICSIGSFDTIIYEILHGQISGALKTSKMMTQLNDYAQKLEMLVDERTKELNKLNLDLKKANSKLENLSNIDGLTSSFNRRFFNGQLQRDWARAIRDTSILSLLLIDIDHFKRINDTIGHQGGDECLIKLVCIIKQIVKRTTDFVCRYGGEEFAIILPSIKKSDAVMLAEEIRKTVENTKFYFRDKVIRLTISIGGCSMLPRRNLKHSLLISMADKALYEAKESGRNNVKFDN
ncbi:MAG: GGDEF domain-containing protein [Spirochaetales bacterium]|nr:GGDEF domain-containing protein [Spirochaetales bacterium]